MNGGCLPVWCYQRTGQYIVLCEVVGLDVYHAGGVVNGPQKDVYVNDEIWPCRVERGWLDLAATLAFICYIKAETHRPTDTTARHFGPCAKWRSH